MAKKLMSWKTKGMNRDLSVSAFNPEFAFENMNLRLSTIESNTMLSWVNEKGTLQLGLYIDYYPTEEEGLPGRYKNYIVGTPIGTAVLNHQLIVFSTIANSPTPDYIYLLKLDAQKTILTGKLLYNGALGFNIKYPLETHVSYEAEHIQKVYWTDGLNQPRLINIAATKEKMAKWKDTSFDFITTYDGGKIAVAKDNSGGGMFTPGVIQYCFTYINKYGQQSNIVDISPLNYLSHHNRGASPEDKVNSSFTITISNIDQHYDYIRLYSIQRTSLNAEPIVKLLEDIPTVPDPVESSEGDSVHFPVEVTYTKGAYPYKTLPIDAEDNNLKVLSATPVNEGETFAVTVDSKEGTRSYDNANTMRIYSCIGDNDPDKVLVMSLQEMINQMTNNALYPDSSSDLGILPYYALIDITSALDAELEQLRDSKDPRTGATWKLVIDESEYIDLDYHDSILVYSFQDQKWYVTSSFKGIHVETYIPQDDPEENKDKVTYVDTGTSGSLIDKFELMYAGGKEISALTMADKDGVLFLGNCVQKSTLVTNIQEIFDSIRETGNNGLGEDDGSNRPVFYRDAYKKITLDSVNGVYSNTHTLKWNNRKITTFKGGDTYRFGFQLQKKTGEWLEPIFMDDVKNYFYPQTEILDNHTCSVNLSYAKANIDLTRFPSLNTSIYRSIRPVIVYPTIADREVLCQGVLNPTVFNSTDRIEKYPYAQASWFFRPFTSKLKSYDITFSSNIIESVEEGVDFDVDEYFKDKVTHAYVAIVEVSKNMLDDFLKGGRVQITEHSFERDDSGYIQEDNWKNFDAPFWGSIVISEQGGRIVNGCSLVLLSDVAFQPQIDSNIGVQSDSYERDYSYVYSNCAYIACSGNVTYPIYKELKTINNTQLYYVSPSDQVPDYTFKFSCSNFYITDAGKHYKENVILHVTFDNITDQSAMIVDTLTGCNVEFGHYSHIRNRDDIHPNVERTYKEVEIQNGQNLYDTPFALYDDTKKFNNTEFFVDQSIVTLNSPDIELDTMVQSYGEENLMLRVIGAIPITGCVSAHEIHISSSMLEESHNISEAATDLFGKGELHKNIAHTNTLSLASSYGAEKLVAEKLWNDVVVANYPDAEDKIKTLYGLKDFYVYPWNRTGSMNNDWRNKETASSWLETKKISNQLYSMYTDYLQPNVSGNTPVLNPHIQKYTSIGYRTHLRENEFILNYKLPKQKETSSEINYYPNIDKVLYTSEPYTILPFTTSEATMVNGSVEMKYKSNSHAVIALNSINSTGSIPILPYAVRADNVKVGYYTNDGGSSQDGFDRTPGMTFWGDEDMLFSQSSISYEDLPAVNYDFLWLGEVYKKVDNPFGGKGKGSINSNRWQVAGEAVPLKYGKATIYWTEGDTFYQRYDCLKTYAFTPEDTNQIVEILSFMCETHVNLDGRYDKYRGQDDNTNMNPTVYNMVNPVYSQQDNFFTYKKLDSEDIKELSYPNQITFSGVKNSGETVDKWTNVTLASIQELDGDKGALNSLQKFNNELIAFQDRGISQILFNEQMQISTTQGVPIEIANSGKVQGKRYLSDNIGCSNKWSIVNTPLGIYFMDSNNKSIYLFNGQLNNISSSNGFNSWAKQNISSGEVKWNPSDFKNFVSYYDQLNTDVMFINSETTLAFSERIGTFTSFYSYQDTPYFCNLNDTGIWIRKNGSMWRHQAGAYNRFFGEYKPYWMTLVCNPEPQMDKIFTNIEFRACVEGDGELSRDASRFTPTLPFDSLEAWNEYQHGYTSLNNLTGHSQFQHHTGEESSLKRKFRIWRCDIPRNNCLLDSISSDSDHRQAGQEYPYSKDSELGISRYQRKPLDRMRNPWLYLKLIKNETDTEGKVETHDIVATYFS